MTDPTKTPPSAKAPRFASPLRASPGKRPAAFKSPLAQSGNRVVTAPGALSTKNPPSPEKVPIRSDASSEASPTQVLLSISQNSLTQKRLWKRVRENLEAAGYPASEMPSLEAVRETCKRLRNDIGQEKEKLAMMVAQLEAEFKGQENHQ